MTGAKRTRTSAVVFTDAVGTTPITKDGIRTMLWSTQNNNSTTTTSTIPTTNNTSSNDNNIDTVRCCCRPIIVQLLKITKMTLDYDDDNNNYNNDTATDTDIESNPTYVLRISDNQYTVAAIVDENGFLKSNNISNNNNKYNDLRRIRKLGKRTRKK